MFELILQNHLRSWTRGISQSSDGVVRFRKLPAGLGLQKTPGNERIDRDLSLKKNPNKKYCLTLKCEQFFDGDLGPKITKFWCCFWFTV